MSTLPIIGRRLVHYERVQSTNDLVRESAERGEPEGLVISAAEQLAGRGRMGRPWIVPRGTSLQLSVLLRPPLAARDAFRLIQMGALAVASTLEGELHLKPILKWPNDVLLPTPRAPLKVAGILTESTFRGDVLEYCVLGIGLNVNYTMRAFPELAERATTLQDMTGKVIDLAKLERALLTALDRLYARVRAGADLHAEYVARLPMLGKRVRVRAPEGIVQGTAAAIAPDGALEVERDGERLTLYAGDVTVLDWGN